jgi:SHS2 domain-containing protein
MKYKILDELTSDVMFEAYGKDKKELFSNSAEALFSIICKIKKVKPKIKKEINVKGKDLKELLFNFLQELIARVDIDEMFFSKFDIKEISDKHLKCICYGESTSPEKGEIIVKAITMYRFKVEEVKDKYKATVSMDI